MLFNSLRFRYFFLPVTYRVFWLLRTKGQRYIWLTLTGYLFYASWNSAGIEVTAREIAQASILAKGPRCQ